MRAPLFEDDVHDELSLAEFVELWWPDEVPSPNDPDRTERFLDRKQASLRMLRRTRPGFPEPTGTSGRTRLYPLGELAAWMPEADVRSGTGPSPLEERLERVSPLWHLRRAQEAFSRDADADAARRLVVAVAVVLHGNGVGPGTTRLPKAIRTLVSSGADPVAELRAQAPPLERRIPELAGVFDGLLGRMPTGMPSARRVAQCVTGAVVSGFEPVGLVDVTLDLLPPAPAAGGGSALTADGLSRLMVAAADPRAGQHILDVAAGQGSLLLHAAEAAGGPTRLTGYEADPPSWAVATARFYLRGLEVDLRMARSLDGDAALPSADIVLADPPFEGRRNYRRWLAEAAACLAPGGRAVVALPAVTLDPGRREWREVGAGIGVLVKGPSRLRTDHGDALALWVLGAHIDEQVLVVDASHLGRQRGVLNDIDADEAELLRRCVRTWARSGRAEAGPPLAAYAVPRSEVPRSGAEPADGGSTVPPVSPGADLVAGSLNDEVLEARQLTERLVELVSGPLRSHTSEEHRRALKRLLVRMDGYLGSGPH